MNQPVEIQLPQGKIYYLYNATGKRIQKRIQPHQGAVVTTDYFGEFQYENGVLQFFAHPEGYVKPHNGGYLYVYQYKDHLDNVRLSYADVNNNGIIEPNSEILEESNYYPFGLKHQGYNEITNINKNIAAEKYKFGDKEWNDELGLNLYDFHARNYDAAIGRWLNVDPLVAQTLEPYQYCGNNPIMFKDPTGMIKEDVIITGNMTQEAFDSLQNTVSNELILSIDSNGKLGVSRISENDLSQGANDLFNAINDKNITVNIDASDDIYNSNNMSFRTGNFMGAKYESNGKVSTNQEINPGFLNKLDMANDFSKGRSILHEVTESYLAGKIVLNEKNSVGPATMGDANNPNSVYYRAHNSAISPGGNLRIEPTDIKDGFPQRINFYTGNNGDKLFHFYKFEF
ncbi:RHS repeat domain-containing protein [Capnocytophaga sp. ARDL2]|uniref:RHS repeat domain-containing protein n=1 Tax=Capnocytophaga sp. ARDL2 TaxID=3238809 RepID=UPI00355878E9